MPKPKKPAPTPTLRAAIPPVDRAMRKNKVAKRPELPATARGREKRSVLKAAATRVLERVGYRKMRLIDVVEEAGVPISLFYHYFSGTAEITEEILTDLLETLSTPNPNRSSNTDAFEAIVFANEVMVETYARSPGLMRCLLHFDEDEVGFSALYRDISHNWNVQVARKIAARFPGESLNADLMLPVAYALGGMFDSFLFEIYVEKNEGLARAFPTQRRLAVFLAIIWYRCLYMRNPPENYVDDFAYFKSMTADLARFSLGSMSASSDEQ